MIEQAGNTGIIIINGRIKCMNTCAFCGGNRAKKSEWSKLVDAADRFIDTGIKKIEMNGRDAGEYLSLVDFVHYMKTKGVSQIYLGTHGRTLKDESLVKSLSGFIDQINISIYGATEEIHNRFTQVKNSPGNAFRDTVQGIKNCAKYNIPVNGNIVPNQYNKETINNIIRLFLDLTQGKMRSLYIRPAFITKVNHRFARGWFLPTKDMGPYLREVCFNHLKIPDNIKFKINEIPYCVIGEYTDLIENSYSYGTTEFEQHGVSIGTVENALKHEHFNIPYYRIKSYFKECNQCTLKDRCCGVSLSEIKLFGTKGLLAIK